MLSTRDLYDASASSWSREGPLLLSDFTARPRVLEVLGSVRDQEVWDLGCGEGYMARALLGGGARLVRGFDISERMVAGAQRGLAAAAPSGEARFEARDLADPAQWPAGSCDAALAVFLFNYLTVERMEGVMRGVRGALRPGGRFVFTVPHPLFPFLCRQQAPFYFDPATHPYTHSRDVVFEGRIWRRDGESNAVRCVHKTLADYFGALARAGWSAMPEVEELGVTTSLLAEDPPFFGPLAGLPLHLLFALKA